MHDALVYTVVCTTIAAFIELLRRLHKANKRAAFFEKDRDYQRQRLRDEWDAQTRAGCTCTWNGENG